MGTEATEEAASEATGAMEVTGEAAMEAMAVVAAAAAVAVTEGTSEVVALMRSSVILCVGCHAKSPQIFFASIRTARIRLCFCSAADLLAAGMFCGVPANVSQLRLILAQCTFPVSLPTGFLMAGTFLTLSPCRLSEAVSLWDSGPMIVGDGGDVHRSRENQ